MYKYHTFHILYVVIKVGVYCTPFIIEALAVVIENVSIFQNITNGLNVSYMWELLVNPNAKSSTIKADFSVKYKLADKDKVLKEDIVYHHYIDISNYEVGPALQ